MSSPRFGGQTEGGCGAWTQAGLSLRPPCPAAGSDHAVRGGSPDPPSKTPASCSTSPVPSSEVPQRWLFPWMAALQTASLPPFPCCSREAPLRLRKKKAPRGSFWCELPLEIWGCPVAKGWLWGWACQRAAGSPRPPCTLSSRGQRQVGGAVERMLYPPHLLPLLQTLPPANLESPPAEWHEGNECFSVSSINYMGWLPQL